MSQQSSHLPSLQNFLKVSAIIPTYNNGNDLKEAILSVSKCAHPILEIIIVDDGSSSSQAQTIVESLAAQLDSKLFYKRKENGGPASARNEGIRMANGDWIIFLDADDVMLPESINSKFLHLKNCASKENIAAIYGSFLLSPSRYKRPFIKSFNPIKRNYIGNKVPGGAPAYIFKKEALEHIEGFDESLIYNEDFDLLLRLIKSGYSLVGNNEPGFIRNINRSSLTRSSSLKALHGGRQFLKKAFFEDLLSIDEIAVRFVINILLTFKESISFLISKVFR